MKKLLISICFLLSSLLITGCDNSQDLTNANIYTSYYPIKYVTETLFDNESTVLSIYPDDINPESYKVTDKLLDDYSKADMFIYNGLTKETDYAIQILNKNKNIRIIDVTIGMEYTYSVEELWLDPSNLLMMAQNIRSGFSQYISNPYTIRAISDKYDALKMQISELDVELKALGEASSNKTIVVASDLYKYLEKYNIGVISLEENDNLNDRIISDVKKMIKDGSIKYIYLNEGEKTNETIQKIIDETKVATLTLNKLSNITTKQKNDKEDYISIMKNNIDQLKKGLY